MLELKPIEDYDIFNQRFWIVKGLGVFKTEEEAKEARRKAGLVIDEEE